MKKKNTYLILKDNSSLSQCPGHLSAVKIRCRLVSQSVHQKKRIRRYMSGALRGIRLHVALVILTRKTQYSLRKR